MDKVVLCETLLKWLQTFNIQAPHSTVQDISDGVAMSQVLAQISPDVFDETWLSKIKTDTSNNWRIKVSNLKKICQGIVDYYQESLAENIVDFSLPDVSRIGEYNDAAELGRMLQLILGCAIKCETKQKYIQTIMGMEESVQRMIMNAIKELLDKETVAAGGGPPTPDPSLSATELMVMDSNIKRLMDDLEAMSEAKEKMAQRCHDLDMQVALLRNEKANLQLENDQLQRRLQELEVVEDASLGGQRYKELKKQLEGLQQEVFKLETSRDDSRSKVEILERDLAELEARNEELQRAADESRGLKDELDVLRDSAERAAKYETTIEGYKKKLEEYADLKKQVRLLEEKNTNYMQQTMELEEELKKSGTWRPQLDLYKKQVAELNHRLGEESKKADKASFESVKMQEKLAALLREKECLMTERDRLRESNEELKCTQLQIGSATHPPLPTLTPDSGNRTASSLSETADILEMIPPEIKERFIRLQHENKILRLNQQSPNKDGDSQPVLQAMIDGLNQRESELQSENRWASDSELLMSTNRSSSPNYFHSLPNKPFTVTHVHEIKLSTQEYCSEQISKEILASISNKLGSIHMKDDKLTYANFSCPLTHVCHNNSNTDTHVCQCAKAATFHNTFVVSDRDNLTSAGESKDSSNAHSSSRKSSTSSSKCPSDSLSLSANYRSRNYSESSSCTSENCHFSQDEIETMAEAKDFCSRVKSSAGMSYSNNNVVNRLPIPLADYQMYYVEPDIEIVDSPSSESRFVKGCHQQSVFSWDRVKSQYPTTLQRSSSLRKTSIMSDNRHGTGEESGIGSYRGSMTSDSGHTDIEERFLAPIVQVALASREGSLKISDFDSDVASNIDDDVVDGAADDTLPLTLVSSNQISIKGRKSHNNNNKPKRDKKKKGKGRIFFTDVANAVFSFVAP